MKYCSNCGKELVEEAVICPSCGVAQGNLKNGAGNDSDSFGWACLGFCIPIVGLILFLVWKDNMPKKAKKAGMGALISTILGVVFYIIYFIFIFAMVGAGMNSYY